jgi:hypothetical protein
MMETKVFSTMINYNPKEEEKTQEETKVQVDSPTFKENGQEDEGPISF